MRDSLNDEVLYPDDLPGFDYLALESLEPLEADDVPHDDANYGLFVALDGDGPPDWAAAPRQLRAFLADAYDEHETEALTFRCLEAEKGPRDHDEWRLDLELTHVDGTALRDDDE